MSTLPADATLFINLDPKSLYVLNSRQMSEGRTAEHQILFDPFSFGTPHKYTKFSPYSQSPQHLEPGARPEVS